MMNIATIEKIISEVLLPDTTWRKTSAAVNAAEADTSISDEEMERVYAANDAAAYNYKSKVNALVEALRTLAQQEAAETAHRIGLSVTQTEKLENSIYDQFYAEYVKGNCFN